MVSEEPTRSRINEAVDRLAEEFRGKCSPEMVREFVAASFEAYQGSRIVDFVPLLVYKSARNQLGALVTAGSTSLPVNPRA
jgi:Protein-tyrosine-phosphatase-like, N-terminal domain